MLMKKKKERKKKKHFHWKTLKKKGISDDFDYNFFLFLLFSHHFLLLWHMGSRLAATPRIMMTHLLFIYYLYHIYAEIVDAEQSVY